MGHEWKVGDWCELTAGSVARWMVFFVHSSGCVSIVNASGHTITHKIPSKLKYLDGCDSWDWQPPTTEPQYRPFANAAEFMPHRDRWVKFKGNQSDGASRVRAYDKYGVQFRNEFTYNEAFEKIVFEDGSPFGVCDGRT